MPREPSTLAIHSPFESAAATGFGAEELDNELAGMPDPRRSGRALALMLHGLAAAASIAFAASLARDVAFAFSPATPVDVGDLRRTPAAALAEHLNRFVVAEGLLVAAGGLKYGRPFQEGTFRTMPVLGRTGIWVEVPIAPGEEDGRWEPPRAFAGRLERFDRAGPSHQGLREALLETSHAEIGPDALLLEDAEDPSRARFSVVLAAIGLSLALAHAASVGRILRHVR